jgi:hypothetical protein
MNRIRAFVSIAAALVAASSALTPVRADEFPSKPIKFLVPAAPAGIGDILPRLFAQKLGEAGSPRPSWSRIGPPEMACWPMMPSPRRRPTAT